MGSTTGASLRALLLTFACGVAAGLGVGVDSSVAHACKCAMEQSYQLELVELDGDGEDPEAERYERERWQDGAILDPNSLYVNWKTWELHPVEAQ